MDNEDWDSLTPEQRALVRFVHHERRHAEARELIEWALKMPEHPFYTQLREWHPILFADFHPPTKENQV